MRSVPLDERGSFAWQARPDEFIERWSTALALEDGWVLVDPVDADGLDVALEGRPIALVVLLLGRHSRDAEALARRHGVPVVAGFARDAAAVPHAIEVRQFRVLSWSEAALWLPERGVLVAGEVLGTAGYYRAPGERLAVHPLARVAPPRVELDGLEPLAIACGHGPPLLEDAAAALEEALRTARRRLPAAWLHAIRGSRAARPRR